MIKTTKEQRKAILRVYNRRSWDPTLADSRLTYRQFRATIQPTFGCDGAIVLPWAGMWLCIERDGYTHS